MPPSTEPALVEIGKLGRPHGVRGELRLFTDDADSQSPALVDALYVRVDDAAPWRRMDLQRVRPAERFWIVTLAGVDGREAASALTGARCAVARDALPPTDDDEYYLQDLIGLEVRGVDDRPLGVVLSLFNNGAHDVLVYGTRGEEQMLPFVDAHVAEVSLERGVICVRPLEYEDD